MISVNGEGVGGGAALGRGGKGPRWVGVGMTYLHGP